ncbi:MAG TPA: acireductone synthase [Vicinamibacterales bacterium]|nr:acireductone synthase [Vicinamibacterales bacterium]
MTVRLRAAGIRLVLLDIEGTTTPIAFVHDVLFPFARARIAAWFAERAASDPEVREIVDGVQQELAAPSGDVAVAAESVVPHLLRFMDADRKSRPLKTLQGKIWQLGYERGALKGEVYADVPAAFARWSDAAIEIGIFSSGSVLAQTLLFRHSTAGDLTPFIRWHFDTAVGAKVEAASYTRIADATGRPPREVLFVSDIEAELTAARDAGMQTRWCLRDPAAASAAASAVPPHEIVRGLDEIAV